MKNATNSFASKLFYLSVLVLVCFPIIIDYQYQKLTQPTEANTSRSFSSSRAFQHLSEVLAGINSHPVDSQQNHLVAQRIIAKLEQMNYSVQVQQVPSCVDSGNGTAHCAMVKNIVVYIEGYQPERTILLSAHYDSVAAAPGASDAGTAVASLLTIAELLSAQSQAKNSVVLLFNDGEEYGLLGARAFVSKHHLENKITDVINIDAIGSSGPSLLIETGKTSKRLLRDFSKASPTPVASSFISDIWSRIPSDTDMTIFKRHGLSGYNFINLETDPHYHTPQDNLENVSLSSLQQHGDNAWMLLRDLLNQERQLDEASSSVIFTDLLATKIMVLTLEQIYLVSILCILLLFFSAWRLYSNRLISIRKTLVSHLLVFSLVIVGGVSAVVIKKLCQKLLGTQEPWNESFAVMQLLLLFSISTVIFLTGHIWSFYNTRIEKLISLSSLYTGGLLLTSIVYPHFSVLFLLVALFGNIILLVNTFGISTRLKHLCALVLFTVACLSFLPALYHLQTMMKFYQSPAIGLLVTVTILPSLLLSTNPNPPLKISSLAKDTWIAITICSLIATACFIHLALDPSYSLSKPKSWNLQLVVTKEGTPTLLVPKDTTSSVLNKLKISDVIPARNFPWSAAIQNSYRIPKDQRLINQVNALSNQLELTGNTKNRIVNLASTKQNLAGIKVFIPNNSQLHSIVYEKQTLDYFAENSKHSEYYEFHCIGESCSRLRLELNFLTDFSGDIWVSRIYHSLPEALSILVDRRNQFASPKAKGDQMILINQYTLR